MGSMIYLVRHGIAEDPAPGQSDFDRRLTREGVHKLTETARGLACIGVRPTVVLHSPLVRTTETAEVLARELTPATSPRVYPLLAPGHSPAAVLRGLAEWAACESVMLVGHEPGTGETLAQLLTGSPGVGSFAFKKAAAAAVEVSRLPPGGPGILHWYLPPRISRALARCD